MQERLQKIIAAAGLASRRHAEEMITSGQVSVNGKVVTVLGTKADPSQDHIKVQGKLINPLLAHAEKVYVLLNKPRGYLTSLSDPENRPLVTDLLPKGLPRVHPVGRLDFNTEGLLLLTNDGDLTKLITTAREHVPKVYHAKVKGMPTPEGIARLRKGISLGEHRTMPATIEQIEASDGGNAWFEVTLFEGRNQQVRKMFDAIGHSVVKLRRVRIGSLTDDGIKPGKHRMLDPEEVKIFIKRAMSQRDKPETGKALNNNKKPARIRRKNR
jgi:23S rRNA pseudouridine2605 synthase